MATSKFLIGQTGNEKYEIFFQINKILIPTVLPCKTLDLHKEIKVSGEG